MLPTLDNLRNFLFDDNDGNAQFLSNLAGAVVWHKAQDLQKSPGSPQWTIFATSF